MDSEKVDLPSTTWDPSSYEPSKTFAADGARIGIAFLTSIVLDIHMSIQAWGPHS